MSLRSAGSGVTGSTSGDAVGSRVTMLANQVIKYLNLSLSVRNHVRIKQKKQ